MVPDQIPSQTVPAAVVADLQASIDSMAAQLSEFYQERETSAFGHQEAIAMVHSLEAQVAALLEERDDLAAQLEALGRAPFAAA